MDIRDHCVGIRDHRVSTGNRLLGIRDRHVGIRDHKVGVDRQLGLKGGCSVCKYPTGTTNAH
jgi:hypothetical protein